MHLPRDLLKHCSYTALPILALLTTQATAETPDTPGISASAMLQTGLGLLLILGLLFLAAYLLKKFNPAHNLGRSGLLRVVGGLIISNRERIVLIEISDTWLIVGIGAGQMRTLHTMQKGAPLPPSVDEKPFGQWLKQMVERKNEAS
ncbi:MAG: flagellar biosynthetic protein FliO [Rhodocyclaceae bacterium]